LPNAYTLNVDYCHSVDTSLLAFVATHVTTVATHVTIQLLFFISAVHNGAATVRLWKRLSEFIIKKQVLELKFFGHLENVKKVTMHPPGRVVSSLSYTVPKI
jgi:hypothetical protein